MAPGKSTTHGSTERQSLMVMSGNGAQSAISQQQLSSGLFITFEGGDGAGKTTQARRLADRIARLGIQVRTAREPGGTEIGEQVRSLVKGDSTISPQAETLLFAAARAQLVKEVLRPALRRKSIVIVDRFSDSTVAYQGYGRGMDLDWIDSLNHFASSGQVPDLTVLLDADPEQILERVETQPDLLDSGRQMRVQREGDEANQRKFESQPLEFHQKVRQGYQELSKTGGRWCVVRADQAQHRVADAIWKRVRPLLIERGVSADLLTRKQATPAE